MCVTRHKSKNFYCSAMDAHVRHVHKIPEEVKFYILTHFSIKINLFWSIIYSKITMALANTTKYLAAVNVLKVVNFTSISYVAYIIFPNYFASSSKVISIRVAAKS